MLDRLKRLLWCLTGLALLCCRGSHRKLDKAKWIARHRAAASVVSERGDEDCYTPISEMSGSNENSAPSNPENDEAVFCSSADCQWDSSKVRGHVYLFIQKCKQTLTDAAKHWVWADRQLSPFPARPRRSLGGNLSKNKKRKRDSRTKG